MFGALDVGIFITGRDGRIYSLAVESRDLAEPDPFVVRLTGEGSGSNGGFTFADACTLTVAAEVLKPTLKAPPEEIAAFVHEAGTRAPGAIRERFGISEKTLRARRERLVELGVTYIEAGSASRYATSPDADRAPTPTSPDDFPDTEDGSANSHELIAPAPNREHPVLSPLRGTETPAFQANRTQEYPDPYGEEPRQAGAARPGGDGDEIEHPPIEQSDIAGPSA